MSYEVSSKGLALIKEFEGCYLKAYQDVVKVWTIGYGITNADQSITGTVIKKGLVISKDTAEKWLLESLNNKYLPKVLKYQDAYNFTQEEIDALVSFAYNIGSIDKLVHINGDTSKGYRTKEQVAEALLLYDKAGGKVYPGLTRRRKAEKALFESGNKKEKFKMERLKKGSVGPDVAVFEALMAKLGYYVGKIDGSFGSGCVDATNRFQTDYPECGTNGKPDGVFGAKCWTVVLGLLTV